MYNLKVQKVVLGILLVGLTFIVSYTATLPLSYRQHLIARINARHQISPSFKSSMFSVWNELDNEENENVTEAAANLCQADLSCVPYMSLPLLLNISLELADKMEGLLLNDTHDLSLSDLNYLASSGSLGPSGYESHHHYDRNPINETDPEDELLSELSQQFSTLIDTYLRKIKQTPELSCLLDSPCFKNLENTAKEIENIQPLPIVIKKTELAPVRVSEEEPKPQSRFLLLTFLYLLRAKQVFKSVLKGVRIIKAMVTLIQVGVTLVGLFG